MSANRFPYGGPSAATFFFTDSYETKGYVSICKHSEKLEESDTCHLRLSIASTPICERSGNAASRSRTSRDAAIVTRRRKHTETAVVKHITCKKQYIGHYV
jgi:hypothetical protein